MVDKFLEENFQLPGDVQEVPDELRQPPVPDTTFDQDSAQAISDYVNQTLQTINEPVAPPVIGGELPPAPPQQPAISQAPPVVPEPDPLLQLIQNMSDPTQQQFLEQNVNLPGGPQFQDPATPLYLNQVDPDGYSLVGDKQLQMDTLADEQANIQLALNSYLSADDIASFDTSPFGELDGYGTVAALTEEIIRKQNEIAPLQEYFDTTDPATLVTQEQFDTWNANRTPYNRLLGEINAAYTQLQTSVDGLYTRLEEIEEEYTTLDTDITGLLTSIVDQGQVQLRNISKRQQEMLRGGDAQLQAGTYTPPVNVEELLAGRKALGDLQQRALVAESHRDALLQSSVAAEEDSFLKDIFTDPATGFATLVPQIQMNLLRAYQSGDLGSKSVRDQAFTDALGDLAPTLLQAGSRLPDVPGVRGTLDILGNIAGKIPDPVVGLGKGAFTIADIGAQALPRYSTTVQQLSTGLTSKALQETGMPQSYADHIAMSGILQTFVPGVGPIIGTGSPMAVGSGLPQFGLLATEAAGVPQGSVRDIATTAQYRGLGVQRGKLPIVYGKGFEEEVPWQLTLTGEIIYDPLNLFTPLKWLKAGRVRAAFRPIKTSGMSEYAIKLIDDPGHGSHLNNAQDLRFIADVNTVGRNPRSMIDRHTMKYSQGRFAQIGKQLVKDEELGDQFGLRMSAALMAQHPSEWSRILNEEVEYLLVRAGKENLINTETLNSLNRELASNRTVWTKQGDEFWDDVIVKQPELSFGPEWRRRSQVKPIGEISSPEDVLWDQLTVEDFITKGHGADALFSAEFAANLTYRGYNPTIIAGTRLPIVSDALWDVMRHAYKTYRPDLPEPTRPANLTEYWRLYRQTLHDEHRKAIMPDGLLATDIVDSQAYKQLADEKWSGAVTIPQLEQIQHLSMMTGTNYNDLLAATEGMGRAMTRERAASLLNEAPATEAMKKLLRDLLDEGKIKIRPEQIEILRFYDAQDVLDGHFGKAAPYNRFKDWQPMVAPYDRDALQVIAGQPKHEQMALGASLIVEDLMTPLDTARYAFTAGIDRTLSSDQRVVSTAGYLRSDIGGILDYFSHAPAWVRQSPEIGPLVDQVANLKQILTHNTDGNLTPFFEEYDRLVRDIAGAMPDVDERVAKQFTRWLEKYYTDSGFTKRLERASGSAPKGKGRFRTPEMMRGKVEEHELAQMASEITAHRFFLDQADDFIQRSEAILHLLRSRSGKDIQWTDLTGPKNEVAVRLQEFGIHPDTVERMLRESGILPSHDLHYTRWTSHLRRVSNERAVVARRLAEYERVFAESAQTAGVDLSDFESYRRIDAIEQYAKEYGLEYPDITADMTDLATVQQVTTVDLMKTVGDETQPLDAVFAQSPVITPPTPKSVGDIVSSIGPWDSQYDDIVFGRVLDRDSAGRKVIDSNFPAGVQVEDNISRALLIEGTPYQRTLRTDVNKRSFDRLRREIGAAFDSMLPEGVTVEAARPAARELANAVRKLGAVASDMGESITVREGRIHLPERVADAVLTRALDDGVAGLDNVLLQVDTRIPSGTPLAKRLLAMDNGSRLVTAKIPRPQVPIFDPYYAKTVHVDWRALGAKFDRLASRLYGPVDQVWGRQARRFTPPITGELTKAAKVNQMEHAIGFIANRVHHRINASLQEMGKASGNPYLDIRDVMRGIAEGDLRSTQWFGDMFENSEWLQQARTWMQVVDPKTNETNWQKIEKSFDELVPHSSVGALPQAVKRKWFGIRNPARGSPVMDGIEDLERFARGEFPEENLNGLELVQLDQFKRYLNTIDGTGESPLDRLRREIFYKDKTQPVLVEDVDKILWPDEALDPYQPQQFAERMGSLAAEIERVRLGYDPGNLPLAYRTVMATKSFFGWFWLRSAARFLEQNFISGWANNAIGSVRPGHAAMGPTNRMVKISVDSPTGSAFGHEALREGFQHEIHRNYLKKKDIDPERWVGQAPKPPKRQRAVDALRWVDRKSADLVDANEIAGRTNNWTREYFHKFNLVWRKGLADIAGLDRDLAGTLSHQFETVDLMRVMRNEGADLDPMIKNKIFAQHDASHAAADYWAANATREVMRDYARRTRFDHMLDYVFPFHYWNTKNLLFVSGTIMDRPATVLHASRVFDQWYNDENVQLLPFSFQRRLRSFTVPDGIPVVGGSEIWINPGTSTNQLPFIIYSLTQEGQKAWRRTEGSSTMDRVTHFTKDMFLETHRESGYRAYPWAEWIASATNEQALKRVYGEENRWSQLVEKYMIPAFNPTGYRQGVALGGWEPSLRAIANVDIRGTELGFRAAEAYFNEGVYGSRYSRADTNSMGYSGAGLVFNNELGTATINADGSMDIPDEDMDSFLEALEVIRRGDYEEIKAHPWAGKILDQYESEEMKNGQIALWVSGGKDFPKEWRASNEANNTFWILAEYDSFIPTVQTMADVSDLLGFDIGTATGNLRSREKEIETYNARIEAAHDKKNQYVSDRNYSPESVAEAQTVFEAEMEAIYNEASDAGLWVPQLHGTGPHYANIWAFGRKNEVTGEFEGANAPWLPFFWYANDDMESIAISRAYVQGRMSGEEKYQAIQESIDERRREFSIRKPYLEEQDAIRKGYDETVADLNRRFKSRTLPNGEPNPEYNDFALQGQIREASRLAKLELAAIFGRAEADGVYLAGRGAVPFQSDAWWRTVDPLVKSGEFEQLGIGYNAPMSTVVSDQAFRDRVQAQTEWGMDQVIETLNLTRYLPNGSVNPRFAEHLDDGRVVFDEEEYERVLAENADTIVKTYNQVVESFLGPNPGDFQLEFFGRGTIKYVDFYDYLKGQVNPQEEFANQEWQKDWDRVKSATPDTRDALIAELSEKWGTSFGDPQPGKYDVDMGVVAEQLNALMTTMDEDDLDFFNTHFRDIIGQDGQVHSVLLTPDLVEEISDRYNLGIQTSTELYLQSAGREAINNFYYGVLTWDGTPKLREEFRTLFGDYVGEDGSPFLTQEEAVDDNGERYQFWDIHPEVLTPEQVVTIRQSFGIPLPPDPNNAAPEGARQGDELYPDNPRYLDVLKEAEFETQTEAYKDEFVSGALFGFDETQMSKWQAFYSFQRDHPELHDVATEIKGDRTWKELLGVLEKNEGPDPELLRQFGEVLSLYEYVAIRVALIEEYDMSELWDARSEFMGSPLGQELLVRDPEFFSFYLGDPSGGGSAKFSGRSGSGGSFTRSSAPRGSQSISSTISAYKGPARNILMLDDAMVQGTAGDAEQRLLAATQVADIIDQAMRNFEIGGVPRNTMLAMQSLWLLFAEQILGEEPTLESWQRLLQVLDRILGAGGISQAPIPLESDPSIGGFSGNGGSNLEDLEATSILDQVQQREDTLVPEPVGAPPPLPAADEIG